MKIAAEQLWTKFKKCYMLLDNFIQQLYDKNKFDAFRIFFESFLFHNILETIKFLRSVFDGQFN